MRPLVTLNRELGHCSGDEFEFAGFFGGTAFAAFGGFELASFALGGGVAVLDVAGERVAEGIPVDVVAVLADELVDRAEGALDPVEEARVGRGRDELDVVRLGKRADLWDPVLERPSWIQ